MSRAFDDLVALMSRLRSPDGCPWDREQTVASVAGHVVEEARELMAAACSGDPAAIREELGDLFYTAVFVAEIARENGWFDADAAIGAIVEKLVRRHPHVFGGETAKTVEDVKRIWERVKAEERESALPGRPPAS